MWTQSTYDIDGPRRWFLDASEADVISSSRERELLLELADCKERLLRTTRRPDGSEWGLSIPDVAFHRVVHELAVPVTGDNEVCVLARRYEDIRGALALANSRLVAHMAKRYFNRGISAADLIQEGFCGLLAAIDRFDTANTTRLATYAGWWIRQALQRAVAAGAYPVRLNPKQLQRLAQALPKPKSPNAPVTSSTEIVPRETDRFSADRHSLAAIRAQISLDAPCYVDDSTPLANLLASVQNLDHDQSEIVDSLNTMFRALNPREQLVLKLRFGLDGEPRHSLNQLGKLLQVSKERVRQIEERAMQKLRSVADDRECFDPGPARGPIAHSASYGRARAELERR